MSESLTFSLPSSEELSTDPAFAEALLSNQDFVDSLASDSAFDKPIITVQVSRSTGNISLSVVQDQWTDTDPSGNATARDLDLVFNNVEVGDWITITPQMYSGATATNVWQDMVTIVNGAVINRVSSQFAGGTGAGGIMGWFMTTGFTYQGGPSISYQVQANDIVNGTIRLRHQHQNKSVVARTISAAGANRFILEGRGPFR